jgi:RHS repeat-associated protein
VWSPVYVDALIERDRDTDSNGTLEERLYAQHDANFNVTAVIDSAGNVVERYVYDPYGTITVLAPTWTVRASSSYAWVYAHQGGRFDSTTSLYSFRNRDYSPVLGRWIHQDPIRYAAGDSNLYRYVRNQPTALLDPSGLQWALVGQGDDGRKFYIKQQPISDNLGIGSSNWIKFEPGKTCDCEQIWFIQAVKNTPHPYGPNDPRTGRKTPKGWRVDRQPGFPSGWYGIDVNGKLLPGAGSPGDTYVPFPADPEKLFKPRTEPPFGTPGILIDHPRNPKVEFITCAICKAGIDEGRIYGCISWGHEVINERARPLPRAFHPDVPQDWIDAVKKWNDQADGPRRKRNHPNQERLGPFRGVVL